MIYIKSSQSFLSSFYFIQIAFKMCPNHYGHSIEFVPCVREDGV